LAILVTGIALSLLLVAAQVLPKLAAICFIHQYMQEKHFTAPRQFERDLLRAPLQTQQKAASRLTQG
jgi:hypothetical protein